MNLVFTTQLKQMGQQIGQLGNRIFQMTKSLTTCNHARAPFTEGKSICPDCGQGLVFQWVVLRCDHCQMKRHSQFRHGQIVPQEKFCRQCGTSAVHLEVLENPAVYMLQKATLKVQTVEDFMKTAQSSKQQKTKVWFDRPTPAPSSTSKKPSFQNLLLAPALP